MTPLAGGGGLAPDPPGQSAPLKLRVVEGAETQAAPHLPEHTLHNLPLALGSFVGRERETAEVKRLVGGTRLLTLTGPGGSGKTRLALAVAADVAEDFEDGTGWVSLAPLSDPALVPQAVAKALSVDEQPGGSLVDTLAEALRSKELLLVLDNCEHLIDACAPFAKAMLASCPRLRVLATSREPLGVAGEANWRVPALAVPDRQIPPEETARYEAVELFVERARSRLSTFELTRENAGAVAEVCRKLEGIPLAVELAAARVPVLSVEQIAQRLEDPLGLLSTRDRTAEPRQRTMRATLEWSHGMLAEPERVLFRRLSVFAGGWTLEAAEAVCAAECVEAGGVLDLLSGLVEKSLVLVTERGNEARYRLLEPVRQYAVEKLRAAGEEALARREHARFFLALATKAEPELRGSQQLAWLDRLQKEQGNLRAALSWALGTEEAGQDDARAQLGLRLTAALWQFWEHGHVTEGRRWLDRALSEGGAPSAARARALNGAGWIAIFQGDERAVNLLEESLTLFRRLEDRARAATSLGNLGLAVVYLQIDKWRLEALLEEAEAMRREPLDKRTRAHLLFFLALAAMDDRDYERAAALAEENVALNRDLADVQGLSVSLIILGMIALIQVDHQRAAAVFGENVRLTRELKDKASMVHCLLGLAGVAALRGEMARSARLWGAVEALEEVTGSVAVSPFVASQYDYVDLLSLARSQLDERSWEEAWAQGRAMALEEAVEYALQAPSPTTPSPKDVETAVLSDREIEVLRLVAEGLTNPQAAQRLYVSPRTVGHHLRSIYRKLGVSSRAAAAREAVERGLI